MILLDVGLGLLLLALAWGALMRVDPYLAVSLFIAFGALLAVAWVRLGAPDVAMTEAAIGAGLTGVLLFSTLDGLRATGRDEPRMLALQRGPRWLIALACLAFTLILGSAVLPLLGPSEGLRAAVASRLPESGVSHPVTAVLLNFRAYDTLLEVAVLLLAALGVVSLRGRQGRTAVAAPQLPLLAGLARALLPPAVVVAAYLLWRGAFAPGGAFQAAAVLAAALLLALLGRLWPTPLFAWRLRLLAGLGLAVFLAVALLGPAPGGHLLTYSPEVAGTLILLVEAVLTASIAVVLVLLVAGRSPEGP